MTTCDWHGGTVKSTTTLPAYVARLFTLGSQIKVCDECRQRLVDDARRVTK